ncbi:hypothetical protein NFC81_12730 [Salinispirillum sp. LH 10-3-1]|uniref:Amylo-alpha-1,6-glucosidase n=1 Tax=Salinispirillum sp. LH 10-3-1 TaxID=2952525 RepID=A0AB38YEW2_9GAMM
MIPLKHNYSYLILDDVGRVKPELRESGLYFLDTRVLNHYAWQFDGFDCLLRHAADGRQITEYWSLSRDHRQELAVERRLIMQADGLVDELTVSNTDRRFHRFTVALSLDSDFADMFEIRGQFADLDHRTLTCSRGTHEYEARYQATDDVRHSVSVDIQGAQFHDELEVAPGQTITLRVSIKVKSSLAQGTDMVDVKPDWLGQLPSNERASAVFQQASDDLRCLLLGTPQGLNIAAGIPWFVTPFGRDSIITAWLLLPRFPDLAKGVLRFLGAHQGQQLDEFRDEQPGKILHEQRYGELSRTGRLPFLTYYGSADATPLYLVLLAETVRTTGETTLIEELQPYWEAALNWMLQYRDERGLIVFRGNDKALAVQSWKDSSDSLSYADGRLGKGALAVAEVQGYAYAAYEAVAEFYQHLQRPSDAEHYRSAARAIQAQLHDLFWMPQQRNFAIAVDEASTQLDINSSDSGHLLWSGVVRPEYAEQLVPRMLEDDMWSGWGLRTLSTLEVMYNPLSYHNGSVWPHDTALFAAGLKRYGYTEAFAQVATALTDLAQSQDDKRLPELVGGYARATHPPLPYLDACRPQAWSAASLIYLLSE